MITTSLEQDKLTTLLIYTDGFGFLHKDVLWTKPSQIDYLSILLASKKRFNLNTPGVFIPSTTYFL